MKTVHVLSLRGKDSYISTGYKEKLADGLLQSREITTTTFI